MRRLAFAAAVAAAFAVAACALKPPANNGYVLCNQMGNDAGCGDNVTINVE